MSKRELVDAYVAGNLSRRSFIRGLVKVGVSAAAAVTYANVVASAAHAEHKDIPRGLLNALGHASPQGKQGIFNAIAKQQGKHGNSNK